MEYYLFGTSTLESEIGLYPQTEGLPDGYTSKWLDNDNSMLKLVEEKLPEFTPDLKWQLKEKAILTDIVSPSNITDTGFLMSEKAKNVFQKFNLGLHKFHDATLIVKQKEVSYWYLQIIHDGYTSLDYGRSDFFVGDFLGQKEYNIQLDTAEGLKNKQESLEFGLMIKAEKIYLKRNLFYLDVIYFPTLHSNVFISERLLTEIQLSKITGFEYRKQSILHLPKNNNI